MQGYLSAPILSLTGILTRNERSFTGVLSSKPQLNATISKDASLHYYQGEYVFTPTSEEQIAHTGNKMVSRDIVINPIPSEYGHISWNGSFLLVY